MEQVRKDGMKNVRDVYIGDDDVFMKDDTGWGCYDFAKSF